METCIVVFIASLFTLTVDLPTQNLVKLLMNSNFFTSAAAAAAANAVDSAKASEDVNHQQESSSDDFESPFNDEEEVYTFRPLKFKYSSYTNDDEDGGDDENVNGK